MSMVRLRKVRLADIWDIYDWRNAPQVRKMMFDQSELDKKKHEEYWNTRLADKDDFSFVIMVDGKGIGVVKMDKRDGGILEVDIFLAPGMHGRGYGSDALGELQSIIKNKLGNVVLYARVKEGNTPSEKMFERNGFVKKDGHFEWRPE